MMPTTDVVTTLASTAPLPVRRAEAERAGLTGEEGLDALLGAVGQLLQSDPLAALRLGDLCRQLAASASLPAIGYRAAYLLAQAHSISGEHTEALGLIKQAHEGLASLGLHLEALRTSVGLIHVLNQMGRHEDALDVGRRVRAALDTDPELGATPDAELLQGMIDQNRAVCLERLGRYDEMVAACAAAESRYTALGLTDRLGEIANNRAVGLKHLGRATEALQILEEAVRTFEAGGLELSHAAALSNIGETHLLLGNYEKGLQAFRRAERIFEVLGATADCQVLQLDIADAYAALNLYPEALDIYRRAGPRLEAAEMRHHRNRCLWGMGSVLAAEGWIAEAEEALDQAASGFIESGNLPFLSGVRLEQADLALASGDRRSALAHAGEALALVSDGPWPLERLYAHLRLADLHLPDIEAAEAELQAAQAIVDQVRLPQLRYRFLQRLGHLRLLQGRRREARQTLEEAVDLIEGLRGALPQEAQRISFLGDKMTVYEDLIRLHLDEDGGVRRALAVAEAAKSRALVDLLAGLSPGRTEHDPDVASRLRALQADLDGIYGQAHKNNDGHRHLAGLLERAGDLEREITLLRLRTGGIDPLASRLPDAPLPDDAAMVAFHIIGDEVMAFVHSGTQLSSVRRLTTVGRVVAQLRRLSAQWERFRAPPGLVARHLGRLEQSTQRVLGDLHDQLMAPLLPFLGRASHPLPLVVIPHGPLHQIPFHALFDGSRHLIESFEVSYAPSVTVWRLCQDRAPTSAGGTLVMAASDEQITGARIEAGAVGRHLSAGTVLIDDEATVDALVRNAPGCGVVHLACHGLFRAENPMFSGLRLGDRWVTAAEVMELDLPGSLVTLSACESGRSRVVRGDETLGLTWAFLGAGAATMVVSLWLVQDEAAVGLMDSLYRRLAGATSPATALRQAQLETRESYSHPYFWAPFVLIGKR